MLKKISSLIQGKKKVVKLNPSNSERIQNARERINFQLQGFYIMKEELDEVNLELIHVMTDSEEQIKKIQNDIDSASAEYKANEALIARVKEFIK